MRGREPGSLRTPHLGRSLSLVTQRSPDLRNPRLRVRSLRKAESFPGTCLEPRWCDLRSHEYALLIVPLPNPKTWSPATREALSRVPAVLPTHVQQRAPPSSSSRARTPDSSTCTWVLATPQPPTQLSCRRPTTACGSPKPIAPLPCTSWLQSTVALNAAATVVTTHLVAATTHHQSHYLLAALRPLHLTQAETVLYRRRHAEVSAISQ
ncbi:hypothetical protein DFP72DRAFT_583122 [Ephemerocybe angulata]|uniref:Uncharacterized protein n=1 Tax=Ephemerocybe angulata TaxID=980116 RepID=A0A8H6HJ72_9AGAR|nr:hypothetical protein DFP72DRAFT_583122 [Tulosesus angulatus]